MSNHDTCTHENTKTARARCRRARSAQMCVTDAEKRAERFADVLRTKGWDVRVEVSDYVSESCVPPRRYVSMRAYETRRGVYASISGRWMTILPNDIGRRESTRWISGELYRSYATKGKKRRKLSSQQDFAHWVWILA
jgi:hypothetical protein